MDTHASGTDPTQNLVAEVAARASLGLVSRQDLLGSGMSRRQLAAAVENGWLRRVSRSLFATEGAHPGAVAATEAGGALTCLSALRVHGVWTVDQGRTHHIRRPEKRRRNGSVPGAMECRSTLTHRRGPLDSLDAALMGVVANHSDEDVVVALDCVLHTRLRDRAHLDDLLAGSSRRSQRLLGVASGLVESPMESLLRFRLWQAKVKVQPQVTIDGVGRVDFLIGKRLIVEVDSVQHHSDPQALRRDRRRDRRAAALGYITLRFTSAEILTDWPRVLATILDFVSRDAHRRPPKG